MMRTLKTGAGGWGLALWIALALIIGCACVPTPTPPIVSSPGSTSTTLVSPSAAEAIAAARLRLAKNGLSNPALVAVIAVTPTTWPDECLGVPAMTVCAPTPTPGYKIELALDQQHYLVHTDQDGTQVRFAWSSIEPLRDAFVTWQHTDAALCKIAMIGVAQMRYGWCGEAMLAASTSASLWSDVHGQSQASYLRNRYASFSATTLRGTLVFTGSGTIVASAAEQRAIAEWALNRFEAANVNYLAADYGQRLFWQEASQTRCGSVWVFQTGLALAWNCSGTAVVATDFLTPAQMQQFYKWIDSGTTWNIMRIGPNGQRISLSLWSNPGGQLTVRTDTENMLGFANDVYEQLTAEDSEP